MNCLLLIELVMTYIQNTFGAQHRVTDGSFGTIANDHLAHGVIAHVRHIGMPEGALWIVLEVPLLQLNLNIRVW